MKISELIRELKNIQNNHGDLDIHAANGPGPEMTIHGVSFTSPGPLPSASPNNNQDDLQERVILDLKA